MTTANNDDDLRNDHVWQFALKQDQLRLAAQDIEQVLERMLNDSSIVPFMVSVRAKSLGSYERKSNLLLPDNSSKYSDPAQQIQDCVAARLIMFTTVDQKRACELIRSRLAPTEDRDPGQLKQNGYSSQHFIVGSPTALMRTDTATWFEGYRHAKWYFENFPGLEIQVRTVAEHAWAEYEHHIRFKPNESGLEDLQSDKRKRIDDLFTIAAEFRMHMDANFAEVDSILSVEDGHVDQELALKVALPLAPEGPFLDPDLLRIWLDARYPSSDASRSDHYTWILEILRSLQITNTEALESVLQDVDSDHVAGLMNHKFPPGQVRRLDDDLLAGFGEKYLEANKHVASEGTGDRARNLAWRFGRIRGKMQVYLLSGAGVPTALRDKEMSGAEAFRKTLEICLQKLPLEQILIPGVVSTQNNLSASARAQLRVFGETELWVNSNLSRASAENYCKDLIGRLPTNSDLRLTRAGQIVAES